MARYSSRSARQADLVEDIEIYPRMVQLAACLKEELGKVNLEATLTVLPGGEPILDFCGGDGCGSQAWIRLVTSNAYDEFPNPPERYSTCFSAISYQLEVGFGHCAPQMDGTRFPSPEDQLEAVRVQTSAMSAMLRAIRCCAAGDSDVPWDLGEYTPLGEEAGCLSATWTVTVGDRREGV